MCGAVFAPQVAEHPLDVTGRAQLARAARHVGEPQHRELHRRVEGDEDRQLGTDAVRGVLEHAVAEAVAGLELRGPRAVGRAGQGGRRPHVAAFLVAQVDRLAAGVADGIVVPRRQSQFVGVLAPGVGTPGLRDHATEARIGEHVDPRRRRPRPRRRRDDVFASVGGKAADAVVGRSRRERSQSAWRRAGRRARQPRASREASGQTARGGAAAPRGG